MPEEAELGPQRCCLISIHLQPSFSVISKVVEKVVDVRPSDHMSRHHLLPVFQSAYCPHHSTETVLARLMNDMILVLDDGRLAHSLLDLSATFDTVDYSVLMNVMRKRFGVSEKVLGWVDTRDSSQAVHVNSSKSASTVLRFGVPQGSVLGPRIFIDYAEAFSEIFSQHDLSQHLYVLINAELSMGDHVSRLAQSYFSLMPSTLSASSARPRRHRTIGLCSHTVMTRLL